MLPVLLIQRQHKSRPAGREGRDTHHCHGAKTHAVVSLVDEAVHIPRLILDGVNNPTYYWKFGEWVYEGKVVRQRGGRRKHCLLLAESECGVLGHLLRTHGVKGTKK